MFQSIGNLRMAKAYNIIYIPQFNSAETLMENKTASFKHEEQQHVLTLSDAVCYFTWYQLWVGL